MRPHPFLISHSIRARTAALQSHTHPLNNTTEPLKTLKHPKDHPVARNTGCELWCRDPTPRWALSLQQHQLPQVGPMQVASGHKEKLSRGPLWIPVLWGLESPLSSTPHGFHPRSVPPTQTQRKGQGSRVRWRCPSTSRNSPVAAGAGQGGAEMEGSHSQGADVARHDPRHPRGAHADD